MSKITEITVHGLSTYYVGVKVEGREVGSINDRSIELENSIDFIYEVIDVNGDVMARIENCPVVIRYGKEE